MHGKYAILIDAAFLKWELGAKQQPLDAQQIMDFTERIKARPELKGTALHRIYYYDAEPFKGKRSKPFTGGTEGWEKVDFSASPMYVTNMRLISELKRKPYFAVRLGRLMFRGWKVKQKILKPKNAAPNATVAAEDVIPNFQQKGVDMRIGLDIATLSLKNQVDIIVLVTGDSDFIPAMKLARREGKQVILYTLGKGINKEVYAHADVCIEETIGAL